MAVKDKKRTEPAAPASLADLEVAMPAPKAGLFDGLAKLFRPRLSKEAAFYAILAGATLADGRAAPEEAEELGALAHRCKTLAKLDPASLERVRVDVADRLARPKRADLIDHAAKSLPKPMRLSAFGHAADLIFADRVILKSERAFLTALVGALELDKSEAESMLRAIRAKNAH